MANGPLKKFREKREARLKLKLGPQGYKTHTETRAKKQAKRKARIKKLTSATRRTRRKY